MQQFSATYKTQKRTVVLEWEESRGRSIRIVESEFTCKVFQNKEPELYRKLYNEFIQEKGTLVCSIVLLDDGTFQTLTGESSINLARLLDQRPDNTSSVPTPKTKITREQFLQAEAEFSWGFREHFFVETPYGNFVWSCPSYYGMNTFRVFYGNHDDWLTASGLDFSRDKGKHFIEDYCGTEIDIIVDDQYPYEIIEE